MKRLFFQLRYNRQLYIDAYPTFIPKIIFFREIFDQRIYFLLILIFDEIRSPQEAAKQAVENDVHILGVSSLAAGHKTLVPQVIEALKKHGREDIMVFVGGVIPSADYQYLFDAGAVAVFGPGTKISEAAIEMLEILMKPSE